ncbi:uncharacterized protein LOC124293381 [Neodiprion lecontei]|uniref:Uncharacterized protein LOC124293381 n=1 Tax=Neodiprion lecontei TaxID=441921 RepID=A0ABM3FQ05_NEOLC|nr:uncharacterized protein LOC124293381 [Neodiprion lecontei]
MRPIDCDIRCPNRVLLSPMKIFSANEDKLKEENCYTNAITVTVRWQMLVSEKKLPKQQKNCSQMMLEVELPNSDSVLKPIESLNPAFVAYGPFVITNMRRVQKIC